MKVPARFSQRREDRVPFYTEYLYLAELQHKLLQYAHE